MIIRWTTCDVCNPKGAPARDTSGRGVAEMPLDEAITRLGWGVRKGKHVCAECLDELDAGKEQK